MQQQHMNRAAAAIYIVIESVPSCEAKSWLERADPPSDGGV